MAAPNPICIHCGLMTTPNGTQYWCSQCRCEVHANGQTIFQADDVTIEVGGVTAPGGCRIFGLTSTGQVIGIQKNPHEELPSSPHVMELGSTAVPERMTVPVPPAPVPPAPVPPPTHPPTTAIFVTPHTDLSMTPHTDLSTPIISTPSGVTSDLAVASTTPLIATIATKSFPEEKEAVSKEPLSKERVSPPIKRVGMIGLMLDEMKAKGKELREMPRGTIRYTNRPSKDGTITYVDVFANCDFVAPTDYLSPSQKWGKIYLTGSLNMGAQGCESFFIV